MDGRLTVEVIEQGAYVFRFDCPCGRISRFAVKAENEDDARSAIYPLVNKHVENEKGQK